MKYLKLYENFNESDIHEICRKYKIENYTINEDGSIDVDGDVNFFNKGLTKLPLKFNDVTGNFSCNYNKLKSLKNCPISVGDNFNCSNNKLTSLEGCPKSVGGTFYCNYNKLTSLEGCPKLISGSFNCSYNKLTSLEGCPNEVSGSFWCNNNQLTSFKFMTKCHVFNCNTNYIRDFRNFVVTSRFFYCLNNPIYHIWKLFEDFSYIELLNDYDCIRGEDIVIDRFNQFLEEIDKPTVKSVHGYNNISMRYLKLYENFNEKSTHEICKEYGIENYTINEDGSIDVNGDVNFYDQDLEEIPLKFRNITGGFFCNYNRLESLKNCPVSVGGNFNCNYNKITSLEYCPEFIGGFFYCNDNKLTSLEYCPKSVGSSFNCSNNKLTSLENCLEFVGNFNCSNNKLTSLEYCPKSISNKFNCSNNQLNSFKFMPKCGIFNCRYNNIRDFKGFVEPNDFYCSGNPIYNIWGLFKDKSYVELLNEYDCIRGNDILIDRFNQFLEEIDEPTVQSVDGYNNI